MDYEQHIQDILSTLPDKPGCYLMKNEKDEIIYVGKAINLKNRVRSYFQKTASQNFKTSQLVKAIRDIDWIVVGSELEALILELNLIKQHRPFYNVKLKDDKRYPYIKVSWADPFPKLTVTRQMDNDGSRYFGPYTSVWAVHQTLDVLRKIFPVLSCNRPITGKDTRPCLYYDLKMCLGPCIGAVDQESYRQVVDDLCKFLEGKTDAIMKRLKSDMAQHSDALNYEKAATIRDQINAIERVVERQKIVSDSQQDSDIIAMAQGDNEACVQVFFIRSGKMIGREYFILEGTNDEENSEVLEEFIKQFYSQAAFIPKKVLLPQDVDEANIIREWLNTKRGGQKVEIKVPKRGKWRELVEMATENAKETLTALETRWKADKDRQKEALAQIQSALDMPAPPNRIECFDISNIQGMASVASMVVFERGVANKKLYRRFNIRSVTGPNDYASMVEALHRRFANYEEALQHKDEPGKKQDLAFSLLPDLLIVDGGKGQLSAALEVIKNFDLEDKFFIAALAEKQDELFIPNQSDSIRLEDGSQGLFLLQRIRDEAHRFAITAHRNRRGKIGMMSRLDEIPGLGPARRRALIERFGSIEGIKNANAEDIAGIKGISLNLAQQIKTQLE